MDEVTMHVHLCTVIAAVFWAPYNHQCIVAYGGCCLMHCQWNSNRVITNLSLNTGWYAKFAIFDKYLERSRDIVTMECLLEIIPNSKDAIPLALNDPELPKI